MVDTGLLSRQEQTLRERAFAERSFSPLLYYYAVLRDFEAFETIADRLDQAPEIDRLYYRFLRGEVPPKAAAMLKDLADPWLHYTAMKLLLRERRIQDALSLTEYALTGGIPDVTPINLAIRFLAGHGEHAAVCALADVSLMIAPAQEDIGAIREAARAGRRVVSRLYLDPLPRVREVAFYIPAYNVEAYIRGAIEGLLAQSHPLAEILVVDDCGTDGSIETVRGYPVRIVSHACNRGLAAARNTAFQHATAEYLGAIDTDACPDPAFTQLALMELENAAPEVCGVGGRLIETYTQSPADLFRRLHLSQDLGPRRIQPPEFLFGANTLYRREAVLEAGGYGEEYRTNSEDKDIGDKLRKAGYSFTFSPLPMARHMRRDTPESVLRTLWGWAFHEKRKLGNLTDLRSILAVAHANVAQAARLMNADIEAGHCPAVYVDFLFLFHDTFHNLRYAAQEGMLRESEAACLQRRLLDRVAMLDARFGGRLCERVYADSAGVLLHGTAEETALPEDLQGWLGGYTEALEEFFSAIPEGVYRVMTAG